jgi:asparagine synthase (glutamine-hydrolysing)
MDTSSAGNQPFRGCAWTLMCNGEIYNAEELRERYQIEKTSGDSDCEVLCQLLEEGKLDFKELINQIYGVYSIVAVQIVVANSGAQVSTRVFIARDPLGVRPLYWVQNDENLVIASEPCALVQYGSAVRVFQPDTAVEVVIDAKGRISPNHVMLKMPSLAYAAAAAAAGPSSKLKTTDTNLAVHLVRNVVEKEVEMEMQSDRPMACFLSGGVDSSTVAALVAKFSSVPIHTFSIGLAGSTDLAFARIVAKHIGSIHHEIIKTEKEFIDAVPEVIRAIQSYDVTTVRASTPMFLLSQYISEHTDFKVVFSGEGPDEVCGSYMYFHSSPGPLQSAEECRRLVSDMHYFDVLRSDRCTARWGLEVRVPLLAVNFIQTYWSIDPQLRVPQPLSSGESTQSCGASGVSCVPTQDRTPRRIEKYIFRKAFEDLLPPEVCWRQKEAFSDGVSAKERSWSTILQEHVDQQLSAEEWDAKSKSLVAFYPHHTPKTKEAFWMRQIYSEIYPQMEHLIPYQWLPKWVGNIQDPSARKLSVYT